MSSIEGLRPFPLLFGLNAAELWPCVNLILPSWLLLMFAPRYRYTARLALIGPVTAAALYTLLVLSTFLVPSGGGGDFGSLEGIVELFRDPSVVFVGWVHYLCYDCLVARWIVLDSIGRGCSRAQHLLAVVPTLFLALMFGPMGFLLYLTVVRTFVLPEGGTVAKAKAS